MTLQDFEIRHFQGHEVPEEVGALRYALFIDGQRKPYPTADHARKVLFDGVDPVSSHLVCLSRDNQLLSALRLTPIQRAREQVFFAPLLGRLQDPGAACVVLSRLIRSETRAGAVSIKPLFKHAYEHCLALGWTRGAIQTSPKLGPLFFRYGWRPAGPTFYDRYAGPQMPLSLDALDAAHLASVGSPYLETTDIAGRPDQCREPNGVRTPI